MAPSAAMDQIVADFGFTGRRARPPPRHLRNAPASSPSGSFTPILAPRCRYDSTADCRAPGWREAASEHAAGVRPWPVLRADGLEFDVHLFATVVVVHHDTTLGRTTSGRGALAAPTADELNRLDAGCQFGAPAQPYRGLAGGVPRLEDVLRRYPSIPLIIELNVNESELAHHTIDALRAADAIDSWRSDRSARACCVPRARTSRRSGRARPAKRRGWPSIGRGCAGPFGVRRITSTRSPRSPALLASLRRDSSGTRTTRVCRSRSGPLTTKPTCGDCLDGESMRSSATGQTSPSVSSAVSVPEDIRR